MVVASSSCVERDFLASAAFAYASEPTTKRVVAAIAIGAHLPET